mmetsp:Transcript_27114/g.42130  ORF Transcript_27114/g.42130 Transcript_27114/m.42130 type:complete len:327 (+) Transcript_27114:296-1276(+)
MTTDPVVIRQLMNTTHSSQCMILIIDELGCSSLDIVRGQCINSGKDFNRSHAPSIGQELPSNVLRHGTVSIETHEHGSLELRLGTLHLFIRNLVYHTDEVVHRVPHEIVELVIRRHGVDSKKSGILVAGVEGADGVRQIVLRDVQTHFAGNVLALSAEAIERAQNGLKQHEGEGILAGPACTLKCQGNVCGAIRIEFDSDVGSGEDRSVVVHIHAKGWSFPDISKVFLRQIAELHVIHGSSSRNHHATSGVVLIDVLLQIGLGQAANVLFRTENGSSEPRSLKGGGVQMVQDQLLLLLVHLLHLAQNDSTLTLNGALVQFAIEQDV